MDHAVFFPGPAGSPAFRRVGSLEEALRLVEHMRNTEDVTEISVHALTEVPLSFRPYYKVEVPSQSGPAEPVVAAEAVAVSPPVEAGEPVAVAPADEPVLAGAEAGAEAGGNGRADSARGLGFFAS